MTRGKATWRYKVARVQLVAQKAPDHHGPAIPTDRCYWLFLAENRRTRERKYFLSNAPEGADPAALLKVALERWQVEQWFGRAKQEAGLGDFEVRTYLGLRRHWLCSRLGMFFLAEQTQRLRGEKSQDHVGAGGAGRPRRGVDRLATLALLLERDPRGNAISSVA